MEKSSIILFELEATISIFSGLNYMYKFLKNPKVWKKLSRYIFYIV